MGHKSLDLDCQHGIKEESFLMMTEPNQAMKTHQLEIDFFSSLTLLFIIIIAPNFFLE